MILTLRVLFMGTPDFAVPSLQMLAENHEVIASFTQPDRPKGRGKKLQPPPVKTVSQDLGIPVYQPSSLKEKDVLEQIQSMSPQAIIVVAYGHILPEKILQLPPSGCINVHASLLPKYRGAAPIHWAVINGEQETGISTMVMDKGLDTGDILLQKKIRISMEDTAGKIHDSLALLGAQAIIETLEKLQAGKITPRKQDEQSATYAKMIDKEVEKIDWSSPAENVFNQVRGLNPWPGAYTTLKGERLKVWKTETIEKYTISVPGKILDLLPGKGIIVGTPKGTLIITELQPPGRKKMSAGAFLTGYNLEKGDILGE